MLKAMDFCVVFFFFFSSSFRKLEKRQLSPNSIVDHHIYLKVYPDYRWVFISDSGNILDKNLESPRNASPSHDKGGGQ